MTETDHPVIDLTDPVLVANLRKILAEMERKAEFPVWAFTNRATK